MDIVTDHAGYAQAIIELFSTTFTASEGADEGALIARLVRDLMETTPPGDLFTVLGLEHHTLVGGIFLSRLRYPGTARRVVLLSPVAVTPDRQRSGIGQHLITHGLNTLRTHGVDTVLTYGDPAYYNQVGFAQITQDTAPAPFPLSQPHGWQGQSLTGDTLAPLSGHPRCVAALNNPDLW